MANKTTKDQAEVINPITSIRTAKLSRARLDAAAKAIALALPADATDEKASVNLYSQYLKGVGGDSSKLVECTVCGGRSPEDLENCPYCDEVEPAKTAAPQEANKMATQTAAPKDTKQTSLAVVQGGKGLAPIPSLVGKTDKDLDRAVQEVVALKAKSAMGMWELGQKIGEIYDGQLWKLRSEAGKPRYRTAEAFCTAELNMSVTHAWSLMDIAKKFTADDVKKFGTSKLGLLLQAPEEARPAIKEVIEKGASKKAVAEEVRKANKTQKTKTRRDAPGKEQRKPAARPAKKLITVAAIVGSQTLKMYAKASVTGEKKDWVPAKRLRDVPTCSMELENGVMLTVTVLEHGDGTMKAQIVIKREEG